MCALENKAQKTKREALEALPRIVHATLEGNGEGYTFASEEITAYLVKNDLAIINIEIKNYVGEPAIRATDKGIQTANQNPGGSTVSTEAITPVKVEFLIEDVALSAAKRGGNGAVGNTKYPFDALAVGQSFFIAATETHPDPVKALASTVSSATNRYSVLVKNEDGTTKTRINRKGREVAEVTHTRVFGIRKDEKDGVRGARIGRTK